MKRKIFLSMMVLMAAFLIAGCLGGSPDSGIGDDPGDIGGGGNSEGWSTYTSDYIGINYPAAWSKLDYTDYQDFEYDVKDALLFIPQDSSSFIYLIACTGANDEFKDTVDGIIAAYDEDNNYTITESTINGARAVKVVFTYSESGSDYVDAWYYIYKGTTMVQLWCYDDKEQYTSYSGIYDEMVKSLQIF